MKLSAPIYQLKSQAKKIKKLQDIALSQALNQVAQQEGFAAWSLLMSKHCQNFPACYSEVLDYLNNGDLVLLGARPGVGKTTFSYGLLVQAIKNKRSKGFLFTLAETEKNVRQRVGTYEQSLSEQYYQIDCSDEICADYIIGAIDSNIKPGAVIVVDYLQLIGEKRSQPTLQHQIESLKKFAKSKGCIFIFICQIDRNIEGKQDQRPTVCDVRLPNPLDLSLFNKVVFLYREEKADRAEVIFAGHEDKFFEVGLDRERKVFSDLI